MASPACVPKPKPAPAPASKRPSPVTHYSLPPDKLAKAHALYTVRTTLHFAETLYGILLLLFILRFQLGAKFRDFAERVTRIRFFQAFLFVPLLTLTIDALSLPFSLYGHHLSLQYGLSVQRWPSWFWDWTKSELIGLVIGSLLLWLLYALIRKSPTRWWFYALAPRHADHDLLHVAHARGSRSASSISSSLSRKTIWTL